MKPPSTDPNGRITWQQLKEDAIKVSKVSGVQYGMLFGQPSTYYQLEPLMASAGGGIGAKGTDNLTPDVNNADWIETLQFCASMFADGASPRGIAPAETGPTFMAGKTGYLLHTTPWVATFSTGAKFKWRGGLHPVWNGGKPVTPTGGWNMSINPFAKDKDAAATCVRWMACTDGGGYYRYNPAPTIPATTEGLKWYLTQPYFSNSAGGRDSAKIIEYETSHTALGRVSTVGFSEFVAIIQPAFSDIANGSDVKSVLDTAQKQIAAAWKKYK